MPRLSPGSWSGFDAGLEGAGAVSVGDYGKGSSRSPCSIGLSCRCTARNCWLSMDPKPIHRRTLTGLSLVTPNRKEAFELAGLEDDTRHPDPARDPQLQRVVVRAVEDLARRSR